MNRFIRVLVLALVVLSTSCATTPAKPVVTSDYDHTANFSAYRTFGFIDKLGTDVAGYQSLVTQTLKASTRREMESRGYTYVDTGADLLINFNAKLAQQTKVSQIPAPPPMYYGYRRGFYGAWGGYGYETRVDQYVQGTLNIDIVDAKRMQLVWEGVAVGRVSDMQDQDRQAALDAAVVDIFSKYPFRVGS